MPKLGLSASKEDRKERLKEEFGKFKRGDLHSGSKNGPVVTSRAQAQAISLSEAGESRKDTKKRYNPSRSSGRR